MKLIKPSYQILDQPTGLDGIYQQIEMAGRTCYRSQRPEGQTAKDFVDRMIKSQHYAMLEHGTVYLTVPYDFIIEYVDSQDPFYRDILCNPWIKYVIDYENDVVYISSNYRWIIENNLENWLQYLCEPTEYHEKRVTVRFTTDRGVSHEFIRHRVFSFAQESTRYCNYSKNKFNNELTFIIPCWMDISEGSIELGNYDKTSARYKDGIVRQIDTIPPYTGVDFIRNLCESESDYLLMLNRGWTPQQARQVLPNALKTELVMTGFVSDWGHFFDLRAKGTTGLPHPDAKALAEPLMQEFINRNYLNCHTNN